MNKKLLLTYWLVFSTVLAFAQLPTFEWRLENEQLTSATTYQFDVNIYNTGSTAFEMRGGTIAFMIDTAWSRRGTLTVTTPSSGLVAGQQGSAASFAHQTATAAAYFRKIITTVGATVGTTIPANSMVKCFTFVLTNTVAFSTTVPPRFTWKYTAAAPAAGFNYTDGNGNSATVVINNQGSNPITVITNQAFCYTPIYWNGTDWRTANKTTNASVIPTPAATLDAVVYTGTVADGFSCRHYNLRSGTTHTLNSGILNVSGNVFANGALSSSSGTIRFLGNAFMRQTTNTSLVANSVTINSSLGVALGGSLTVNDTLSLNNGNMFLSNNNLIMGSSAKRFNGSASSYIVTNGTGTLNMSNIGATPVTFPVGTSTGYNPVTLQNTGTLDNFQVSVADTVSAAGVGLTANAVKKTWKITETNPGSSNLNINLQWNAADELPSFNRANSYISFLNNSGLWQASSQSAATGSSPYVQTLNGVVLNSSFSSFAVASNNQLNEQTTYTINASSGNNGSISPSGITTVNANGTQRFTFTPNTGYKVDSVIVDGIKVDSLVGYTFNNVMYNRSIRVTFSKLPPYINITGAYPSGSSLNTNTSNNIFASYQVIDSVATALLSSLSFTTLGSYTTADIKSMGFKCWLNSSNDLVGATQIGTSQVAVASGGVITLSGLSQNIPIGTSYILVTCNISNTAENGNTIGLASTPIGNFSFSGSPIISGASTLAATNLFTINETGPVKMQYRISNSYKENFSDVANWTNGFASGLGAGRWAGVTISAGTIPNAKAITVSTANFQTSSSSAGIQRGSLTGNVAGTLAFLSLGNTDNTSACAVDFFMDYTRRNADSLIFDAATVFNGVGNRNSTLRVYWSIDGTNFTELTGANLPYTATNNVANSANIRAKLPTAFNNVSTCRLRFYYHNGTGGTTSSRPKISIDNVQVSALCPIGTSSTSITSCTPYTWNGITYNASGIYNKTFSEGSVWGCDSVASLNLNINSIVSFNPFQDTIKVCGRTYNLNSGAGYTSYLWSSGATTATISPTKAGWYKVTVSNGTCSASDSVYLSLNSGKIAQNEVTVCPNTLNIFRASDSATITFTSFLWSTGATSSQLKIITSVPTKYYCIINNGINSCKDSVSVKIDTISLFNPFPDTLRVCGTSYNLNAGSGYISYIWNTGATNTSIVASNANLYKVTVSNMFCSISDSVLLSLVNVNITNNDTIICYGKSISLNAIGSGVISSPLSYLWSNAGSTQNITVSPALTTTYYCTVSNGINSCMDSVKVSKDNFNPNLFVQDTLKVCGTSYTLNADSGYVSYVWNTGSTARSLNTTTAGWKNCTVSNGLCSSKDSVLLSLVNANITNRDTTICLGKSITLNATGSGVISSPLSYLWSNAGSTQNITVSPALTTTYYCTVSNGINSCMDSVNVIKDNFNPNLFLQDTLKVCGTSYTLNADSGYVSYVWNTGSTARSLNTTTAGWKNCTVSNRLCNSKDSVLLSLVNANITNRDTTICLGKSITLNVVGSGVISGPLSYLWSNAGNTQNITVSPALTTTYYCTVSNGINSCMDSVNVIKDNFNPNLFLQDTLKVCGTSYTLNADSGYVSYVWNTGSTARSLNTTTAGWKNCTVSNGLCSSKDSVLLSLVNANITNRDTTICLGKSIILNATGSGVISIPLSYLWSNAGNTQNIIVSPALTTTYYCTVSNGINSCRDSVKVTKDNFNPNLFVQDTLKVCGTSYTLNADSGYVSYVWNTGSTARSLNTTTAGWKNCTVSNGLCSSKDSVLLSLIHANIINNDSTIMAGTPITLRATGTGIISNPLTYLWSSGANTQNINVSPTQKTTYYCTVSNGVSSCRDSVKIGVNVSINLKMFFEAFYENGRLKSSLNNADGSSDIGLFDTVQIILYDSISNAIVYTIKSIADTGGVCQILIPSAYAGSRYYIGIKHRGSIETWTNSSVLLNNGIIYNFTTAASKAYGDNLVNDGTGIYLIYNGDVNQDGSVDFNDYPDLDIGSNNGDFGYFATDLNGDASVDFNDYPILDINSNDGIIALTPIVYNGFIRNKSIKKSVIGK